MGNPFQSYGVSPAVWGKRPYFTNLGQSD